MGVVVEEKYIFNSQFSTIEEYVKNYYQFFDLKNPFKPLPTLKN
jgi:hypothetical protein